MSLLIRALSCALIMSVMLTTACLREKDRCERNADCFASETCSVTGRCIPTTSPDQGVIDMSSDMLADQDGDLGEDAARDMPAADMGEAVCPACPDGACCVKPPPDGEVSEIRTTAARVQSFVTRAGRIYVLITHSFGQVQLASWDGSAWSSVEVADRTSGVETAAAALDTADTLHIVYLDKDGEQVLYRTFNASGLGSASNVFDCKASFKSCVGAVAITLDAETQRPVIATGVERADIDNRWALVVLMQRQGETWRSYVRTMLFRLDALRLAHLGARLVALYQHLSVEPNVRLVEAQITIDNTISFKQGVLNVHSQTKASQVALMGQGATTIFAAALYNFEAGMEDRLLWARDAGATNEIGGGPYTSPSLLATPGEETIRMVYLKQQEGQDAVLSQRVFLSETSGVSPEAPVITLPLAGVDRPLLSVATNNGRDAHVFYQADDGVRYASATLP